MPRRPNYGQDRAERSKKARLQRAGDGPPSAAAGGAKNESDTGAGA